MNYISVSLEVVTVPEQPTLSPTDVAFMLAQRGIRASRDRIARMADQLYGRESNQVGRHRRFSPSQVDELGAAFLLVEGGVTRGEAARMLQDPAGAAHQIKAEAEARIAALRRIEHMTRAMIA